MTVALTTAVALVTGGLAAVVAVVVEELEDGLAGVARGVWAAGVHCGLALRPALYFIP